MGSTVSVCNMTAIILNVALKHLGPVYYTNHLMPDTCAEFKTGNVWFTVEAKIWKNGTNDYTDAMMILPMVGLQQGVTAVANGIIQGVQIENLKKVMDGPAVNVHAASIGLGFIPGAAIGAAGAFLNERDHVNAKLFTRKHFVLMKDKRKIEIKGGPKTSRVEKDGTQLIDYSTDFDGIRVEIAG